MEFERRFRLGKGDLLGPAFEVVHNACRTFDPAKGAISTHIVRALQLQLPLRHRADKHEYMSRKCADGKVRRHYFEHDELRDSAVEAPETPSAEAVRAAIDQLDETKRLVLISKAEGKTFAEIGLFLGCSLEWARQHHIKAVAEVRRLLRADGDRSQHCAERAIEAFVGSLMSDLRPRVKRKHTTKEAA